MKYKIILPLVILIAFIIYIATEDDMKKYIHTEGNQIWDATPHVTSGEYYFDCGKRYLVRREPMLLTAEMISKSKGVEYKEIFQPDLIEALQAFQKSDDWPEGFTYKNTFVLEGEPVLIMGHNFEKLIQFGRQRYVIRLYYHPSYIIKIGIVAFDPDNYQTYEQMREHAKNSCEHPQ